MQDRNSYKMLSVFVSVVSIIIYSPTSQHFISPQEPCYLSHICNHTWISECGFDEVHSHRRKFLDECDRFEYNCDYSKGYMKIEMSECQELDRKDNKTTIDPRENKTSVNETYSNDTTITSTTEPKSTEPSKYVIDEPDPSNFTTVTEANISTTKSSENICLICTRSSENETLLCKTLICDNSTITSAATPETMCTTTTAEASTTTNATTIADTTTTPETMSTKTTAGASTTTNATTIIDTTTTPETMCTKTTAEASTTTKATTITDRFTTISTTVTEASSKINSSTTSEETTKIDATATTQATIITNATTLTEASTTEGTTTLKIEDKINSTIAKLCSTYPEDCDRPTTWETTVEGETRDFFQILKERFGRRAIVMKHTTHFPKQKSLYKNLRRDAAFLFGNHIEKHRLS